LVEKFLQICHYQDILIINDGSKIPLNRKVLFQNSQLQAEKQFSVIRKTTFIN